MESIFGIAARCFDSSESGIVISQYTADRPIIYCNDSFCRLTGYKRPDVLGKNCRFLQGAETNPKVRSAIRAAVAEGRSYRTVIKNYRQDGVAFWNDLFLSPIRDEHGNITHYLGLQNDIRNLDRNNRNVPFHFPYDDLTQLPTPTMGMELLKMSVVDHSTEGDAIFLGTITVNGLANLRGFLQNSAADVAILEMRDRLQSKLAEGWIMARAGENEFIVAGMVSSQFDSYGRMLELCSEVLDPVTIDNQRFQLTYNGGFISNLPLQMIEQSARLSSFALAQSHHAGRNRITEFTSADLEQAKEDQMLAASIPIALSKNEFYCAYQPQVDLSDGRIIGFEALARWQHPEFGTISPGRFIPLCESAGYINTLTLTLLRQVCEDLGSLQSYYPGAGVSLNLSPLSLLDREFIQTFIRVAKSCSLPTSSLKIEVVENLSIDGYESAAENLNALRDAGLEVILDDFGTGYSSLSYIRKLGASVVKIDREFVMDLNPTDLDNLEIIRAVVSLGKQFGFAVIAEGIEQQHQADLLSKEGVPAGQGYHFARPMRLEHFLRD